MAESYDLIIRNGSCFTPSGLVEADIGVRDGTVIAIGVAADASAGEEFDAGGLTVLPGIIDSQVHFREPGLEHKEDLESGTRSAVMGGVTAVFEMPNTDPSTTTEAALNEKLKRADGRAWSNYAFFLGAASDNAEQLGELERLPGCCGIKIFMGSSTGNLLVEDDATLLNVLSHGKRRCSIHAEDEYRLRERFELARDSGDPAKHPEWRDAESALLATQRIVALARKAGRRVHVLHISTAIELDFLAKHKDIATVEATPQHLTLAAPDCYERLGTKAQMNPPIRTAEHREGLWRAIQNGIVDVIGSDHAPHTLEEKQRTYPKSPSGMPGVQTTVPLMLNHIHEGRLTLARFVDLMASGPQRIFNIQRKGRIAVGYDADFTIVDLKKQRTITDDWSESKCGWTPFAGMTVTGWPMATVIGGQFVMREDELLGKPIGKPVRFQETISPE
jgi:dihydroorotase